MNTSKTSDIFKLTAPYTNPYQGEQPRLLFVCSVGMLRSPTCADVATAAGFNARSCGSDVTYALIPASYNLIHWADKIICMQQENLNQLLKTFPDLDQLILSVTDVWDIRDSYDRNERRLIDIASTKVTELRYSEEFVDVF